MKVRNIKKQYSYIVFPEEEIYKVKKFKTKRNVLKYLRSMGNNGIDALNSTVRVEINGINFSCSSHQYTVWFNQYEHLKHGEPFKLVLKWDLWRGEKYISQHRYIDRGTVRYFTKSDQIISLMSYIGNMYNKEGIFSDSNLKNLIKLFKYRFGELPDNAGDYGEGIEKLSECAWSYWSDRCGYERASTIIKCIRNEKPYLL